MDLEPNFGYRFERKLADMLVEKNITVEEGQAIRKRVQKFLIFLFKQLKQRMPENFHILKDMKCFAVDNVLRHLKEPITPLLEAMNLSGDKIETILFKYNGLHLNKWVNLNDTEKFWDEVSKYQDASGGNSFKEEAECALNLLSLPNSNAEVERLFSSMNIIKTKLRNKMQLPMLHSVLSVKYGLKRYNKCCKDYILPDVILKKVGTMQTYATTRVQFLKIVTTVKIS